VIQFQDSFEVALPPVQVMQRFADVERIAEYVPGVAMEGRDDEGNYLASMIVAFGPKRIKFHGKLRCQFDFASHSGVITGGGSAGRSASVAVRTDFTVREAPFAKDGMQASIVEIRSTADLQGTLAQFAMAGGASLAKQLMLDFSQSLAAQLATESLPSDRKASAVGKPISAVLLLFRTVWTKLLGLAR
jgi:carbon monoxide dehydrogenase subunit G